MKKQRALIRTGFIIMLVLGLISNRNDYANAIATGIKPDLKDSYLQSSTPAKIQKRNIPVQSWKESYLKATLYQLDSRKWVYDLDNIQYGPFDNLSGDVPEITDVEAKIEINSPLYAPDNVFESISDGNYPVSRVPLTNREISYVESFPRIKDQIPPTVLKYRKKFRQEFFNFYKSWRIYIW